MEILKRAKILFDAWNNRRSIEQAHNLNKAYSFAKFAALFGKTPRQDDFPLHPAYGQILVDKLKGIEKFKSENSDKKNLLLIIGDSLSDFTRGDLTVCYPELNLALAGQGSTYYEKIITDTYESLKGLDIKYVMLECWGNEFLGYFDLDTIKSHVSRNFNYVRSLYPNAKIIVGGLPPVYDIYTNTCKLEFHKYLINLVTKDSYACFIALQDKFSGAFGLFPKINYSSDGVHFTGKGILQYDEVIRKAMTSSEDIIL